MSATQEIDAAAAIEKESKRIAERRRETGLSDHPGLPGSRWALALSGGGIRSATFALGVLQGLATHSFVHPKKDKDQKSWLQHFDYLSTVSGGGYIGGFLCGLFVPGRLSSKSEGDPKRAAEDAYKALQYDPPGRPRRVTESPSSVLGEMPLAWLRNNGRYLAPTGAGDMFYAGAIAVRNWVSLHVVIGALLLALFATLGLARHGSAALFEPARSLESALLDYGSSNILWPSSVFILPLAMLAPLLVVGFAYWLAHPDAGEGPASASNPHSRAAMASYGLAFIAFSFAFLGMEGLRTWARCVIGSIGVVCLIAPLVHAGMSRDRTVDAERSATTRLFARLCRWTVVLLLVALVDSLGQSVYLWLRHSDSIVVLSAPAAVLAAGIWIIRKVAKLFDTRSGLGAKAARLPISWIAGGAALVMFVILVTFWELIVQFVMWNGAKPSADAIGRHAVWASALMLALCAGVLAFVMGLFAGFINLSTLQRFYGARLTRAYLGSSNGKRFEDDAASARWMSASEPHPEDDLTHGQYYLQPSLAPVHLINVTVNQTTDDGDQLVQRDRKGRHMAIGPTGFSLDDRFYRFEESREGGENEQPMTIGQWISTSGAAFTTGLGRQTSLGASLALGLANVRLGTWWKTGVGEDRSDGFESLALRAFKSQTYLAYECLAQFHGLCRPWQYLSDGGHFENTAIYPLLTRKRNVSLIVVCDNGADPEYQFEDMANAIRLARIDHRIEFEIEEDVLADDALKEVFGRPEDFRTEKKSGKRRKCALFFRAVGYNPEGAQDWRCAVIVLKPTLVDAAPEDVLQYGLANEEFPQQPTADQFFDEAQWESYRKLGRAMAQQVFGQTRYGPALAKYLEEKRYIS